MKGISKIEEAKSDLVTVRYEAFLIAGVERWKEYHQALQPLKKKPVLFIMMNGTREADEVADWLQTKYPRFFIGDKNHSFNVPKRLGKTSDEVLEELAQAVRRWADQLG